MNRMNGLLGDLDIENADPEYLEAMALVLRRIRGIAPPPVVHPVTGEPISYPLSEDDCAAINHHQIFKYDGLEALRALDCDCSYCSWRLSQ